VRVGARSLLEIAKILVVNSKYCCPNLEEAIFKKIFALEVVSEVITRSKSN